MQLKAELRYFNRKRFVFLGIIGLWVGEVDKQYAV